MLNNSTPGSFRLRLLLGLAMVFPLLGSAASVAFLTASNAWKYNDESVDLGTAWFAPGYNDSVWSNSLSAIGFRALNNGNYLLPPPNILRSVYNITNYVTNATVVTTNITLGSFIRKNTPTNAARNILTYYFRTHFTFTNKPGDVTLTASNLIDDGAIFYINGRELTRVAMPIGPVNWSTLATRADDVGTNATGGVNAHGYDVFSVPVDALVQGIRHRLFNLGVGHDVGARNGGLASAHVESAVGLQPAFRDAGIPGPRLRR